MAITNSLLVGNRDTNDLTNYNTAAHQPNANELVIAIILSQGASVDPVTPTLTGNNLTWVNFIDFLWDNGGATRARLTAFRAMGGSPTNTATAIVFGTAPNMAAWSISQFAGTDTSGTNGSGAIVQTGTTVLNATGTSGLVTLAALASATSATFGAFAHQANEATTVGSGFTSIHDIFGATPVNGLETEWKINDNTVDASWTTSISYGGVAFEIKEAGGGAAAPPSRLLSMGVG